MVIISPFHHPLIIINLPFICGLANICWLSDIGFATMFLGLDRHGPKSTIFDIMRMNIRITKHLDVNYRLAGF